ncbi:hypothetical protein [Streptomyces bicolor]|uniref:hypothetical protein n=1 Tax=Streptomyces bicolor TaxID=66874 RepID=UPI0004E1096D|nr:hypothetical protein [Streptomyces bicolor]
MRHAPGNGRDTGLLLRPTRVRRPSRDAHGGGGCRGGLRSESAVRTYQLTRVVLTDESGVYGTATRSSLESETSEP